MTALIGAVMVNNVSRPEGVRTQARVAEHSGVRATSTSSTSPYDTSTGSPRRPGTKWIRSGPIVILPVVAPLMLAGADRTGTGPPRRRARRAYPRVEPGEYDDADEGEDDDHGCRNRAEPSSTDYYTARPGDRRPDPAARALAPPCGHDDPHPFSLHQRGVPAGPGSAR